jgi:hypothetical protein
MSALSKIVCVPGLTRTTALGDSGAHSLSRRLSNRLHQRNHRALREAGLPVSQTGPAGPRSQPSSDSQGEWNDNQRNPSLDLEGVRLASTWEAQELVWGKGEPISKGIAALLKSGGQMLLCPHCSRRAGIKPANLRMGCASGERAKGENGPCRGQSAGLPT